MLNDDVDDEDDPAHVLFQILNRFMPIYGGK